MKYFIGVVPPDPTYTKILLFQKEWNCSQSTEPHITVKAQSGLTGGLEWLKLIEESARNTPPFRVSFGIPGNFGEKVVFLNVDSPKLRELHFELVKAIAPSPEELSEYKESKSDYTPHLTLGTIEDGLTWDQLSTMKEDAWETFRGLPDFDVTSIRVYEKSDDRTTYEILHEIPLSGMSV